MGSKDAVDGLDELAGQIDSGLEAAGEGQAGLSTRTWPRTRAEIRRCETALPSRRLRVAA
jgi:hypothetical protein